MIKGIVKKVGFSNLVSIFSLFISLTCLTIVARISQEHSNAYLGNIEPEIITPTQDQVKVTVIESNLDVNNELYDNVLNDIDKLIEKGNSGIIKKEIDSIETTTSKNNKDTATIIEENIANTTTEKPAIDVLINQIDEDKKTQSAIKSTIKEKDYIKPQKVATAAKIQQQNKILLGTFSTHGEAVKRWFSLREQKKDLPLAHCIERSEDQTTQEETYFLKIIAQDHNEAQKICDKLKIDKIDCDITT